MTRENENKNPIPELMPEQENLELKNTHFDFTSKVFRAPGARFILRGGVADQKTIFSVSLGEGEGHISIKSLCAEFNIRSGTNDADLMPIVEKALRFVEEVRPGDSIPSEIVDGTASWTVSVRHSKIARERLQLRLLEWVTGEVIDGFDENAVRTIMGAPETKTKLRDAFRKAALQLQLQKAEEVVDRIELLVRELCYIEALREQCNKVREIRKILPLAAKRYGTDQRFISAIKRCEDLAVDGERELFTHIAMVDIKFYALMDVLKSVDVIIKDVRQARDSVRRLLFDWNSVFVVWKNLDVSNLQKFQTAIDSLSRLLMRKFPTARSIVRHTFISH